MRSTQSGAVSAPVPAPIPAAADYRPTLQHLMLTRGLRNFSQLSRRAKKLARTEVGVTAITLMNRGHRGNRRYRGAIATVLGVTEAEVREAINAAPWDVLEDGE